MLQSTHKLRLAGAIMFTIALLAFLAPTATYAQNNPSPTGTLTVNTFDCVRDDQPEGTISLTGQGGLDGFDCTPDGQVQIAIDGEPVTFDHRESLDLPVGAHELVETSQNATLDIEIAEGAATVVNVSVAVSPAPTESPTVIPTDTEEAAATNTPEATATATETAAAVANQIAIVAHLCPDPITSRSAFDALPDYWAKIDACPSIVLTGDDPAPDGITSGPRDFTVIVEGSDLTTQPITDVTFEQRIACEIDFGTDINGNPDDNLCLDLSQYIFGDVKQGAVTIRASGAPTGTKFVGVAYDPRSTDEETETRVGSQGTDQTGHDRGWRRDRPHLLRSDPSPYRHRHRDDATGRNQYTND